MRRSTAVAGLLASLALGLALAACGGGGGGPPECASPRATSTVVMDDFVYEPSCIETSAGTELEIVNEGQAPHTFTVEADGGGEVDLAAGDRASLAVPNLAAGTYRITCTYHPQMEGALRIS
jgi:plastocyanin